MPALNWGAFAGLPGSPEKNFELLCRGVVRHSFGSYGVLRALANQPGVEFHLKLDRLCDALGNPGRWWGWQCKWYELPASGELGATRRAKIEGGVRKTETHVPGVTDWVLWTRRPLTSTDQEWFRGISSKMTLRLWTADEIDNLLVGQAAVLRGTYFGELVLTPEILRERHEQAVAPIRARWQPEVHHVVDAERELRRMLGESGSWDELRALAVDLRSMVQLVEGAPTVPTALAPLVATVVDTSRQSAYALDRVAVGIRDGDLERPIWTRQRWMHCLTLYAKETQGFSISSGRYEEQQVTRSTERHWTECCGRWVWRTATCAGRSGFEGTKTKYSATWNTWSGAGDRGGTRAGDRLRARWVMWALTSTVRRLRDQATRALYWFGRVAPEGLFELTIDSLAVNDAYVGERMLAASYGVVMSHQQADADFEVHLTPLLERLANALVDSSATAPTNHYLARLYVWGIIAFAERFYASALPDRLRSTWSFGTPAPVSPIAKGDPRADEVGRTLHMDFENYTLGRLFEDRSNYDMNHQGHQAAVAHVRGVVWSLGWRAATFETLDRAIADDVFRSEGRGHRPRAERFSIATRFDARRVSSDRRF